MNKHKLMSAFCGLLIPVFVEASPNYLEHTFNATNLHKEIPGSNNNRVNGVVPSEAPGGISKMIMNETNTSVNYRVEHVLRKPGLRSVVHYHLFPITTCVLRGVTTLVLEGYKERQYGPGSCFIMPPKVKGYNVNRGKTEVELIDFLASKPNTPFLIPLEKVDLNNGM